ncbi:MAG TPA: hypothetical protein VLZ30_02620, partial [Verrucomicrobiae bacterium]|nr:hypothetical protein [Verrucomicrobiae bacterium]
MPRVIQTGFKYIAVPVFLLGLADGTVMGATNTWIAGSGDFNTAANWDTDATPAGGDDVMFTNNTSYTVSFANNSALLTHCTFSGHVGAVTLDMGSSILYTTNQVRIGRYDSTSTVYMVSGTLYCSDGGAAQIRIGDAITNAVSCVGTFIVTNGTVYADAVNIGASATASGTLVVTGPAQWIYDDGTF